MALKPFAWSYSALNEFETCPRKYAEIRVYKRWQDSFGEAAEEGKRLHTHLENRLKYKTPLPAELVKFEPLLTKIESAPGTLQAEYKLALNSNFQATGFFDKDAWVRAVGDVVIANDTRLTALDWKTGKQRDNPAQLQLQALIMFNNYPQAEVVSTGFIWLKTEAVVTSTVTREQAPGLWASFLARLKPMQEAYAREVFPPKPNGLCRNYCPVKSCEHNG